MNTSLDTSHPLSRKRLIARYALYLAGMTAVLILGVLLFYFEEGRANRKRIFTEEQASLRMQRETLTAELQEVSSDLMVLREQPALMNYLARGDAGSLKDAGTEYFLFCRYRGLYDQVRFLDDRGMEIIRVNYREGRPVIVDARELQQKGKRYYFTDAIVLKRDEVYVSPFDLNIEGNALEVPYKPMIRFATPVFDRAGRKRGIVVLNYLGARLLNALERMGRRTHGQSMLLNRDGYWLHHPDTGREWGFMFPDRKELRFSADFPEEWRIIQAESFGQVETPRGVFTFETVHAVKRPVVSSTGASEAFQASAERVLGAPEWKLVSYLSRQRLRSESRLVLARIAPYSAVLFFCSGIAAWLLAQAGMRRTLYQEHLRFRALHDGLTEIPNRELFMDRLEHTLQQANRYERRFALLYLDLDGFKEINDSLGHQAGDQVLKAVAARLDGFARGTDTVARMGGDEFVLLLDRIKDPADAETVAAKLLQLMSQPFEIRGRSIQVGMSIGISWYPNNGRSAEELLSKADQAMYRSKECGKNCFSFAFDTDSRG